MTLYGVELEVTEGPEEAASLIADELVAVARAGGSIVLTGGTSPGRAYELAAEREPDWSPATLWWGDERCVPPEDERSNFRLARETLLDRLEAGPRDERIRLAGAAGSGGRPNARSIASAFDSPVTMKTTSGADDSAGAVSVTRSTNGSSFASAATASRSRSSRLGAFG